MTKELETRIKTLRADFKDYINNMFNELSRTTEKTFDDLIELDLDDDDFEREAGGFIEDLLKCIETLFVGEMGLTNYKTEDSVEFVEKVIGDPLPISLTKTKECN